MKKIFISLFLIASFLLVQGGVVKVTLKNGTSITGELKELDPTNHVTIIVAGTSTTISMGDVISIEDTDSPRPSNDSKIMRAQGGKLNSGEYVITDNKEYPETFILNVYGVDFHMILVRGGNFNMGFDGRHSLSMNSEPIHQVTLPSFYVSKELINNRIAKSALKFTERANGQNNFSELDEEFKEPVDQKGLSLWSTDKWSEAYSVIEGIASKSGFPCRMQTEAEWEYMAIQNINVYTTSFKSFEWCYDVFSSYPSSPQFNPVGTKKDGHHVKRSYNVDAKNYMWHRYNNYSNYPTFLRIAISADEILKNNF